MTKLFSVKEVADKLRVSRITINNLIKKKEIQAIRIGKLYRIEETHLETFLARQTTSH